MRTITTNCSLINSELRAARENGQFVKINKAKTAKNEALIGFITFAVIITLIVSIGLISNTY